MTLAYAAGIGDLGPATFDDAGDQPLMAPPSFCSALEWPVVANQRRELLGLEPDEARRAVHAEQDSTFHRPIRPGDRVRTGGRIAAIRQTRAGALVQTRIASENADDGTPIVTSWHTAIFRGVPVTGEGGRVDEAPSWPAAAALERSVALPIPRQAAHVYTECSGLWNPIHTERRVALAVGLPDIILHGAATFSLAGREIVAAHADGAAGRLLRLRGRFRALIVPGSTVTLLHAAGSGGEVHFVVRNEQGEEAIAGGFAQLAPTPPKRAP